MPAPREVIDLVERFKKFNSTYLSQQYNETQLRIEFINPLFEALGWDVSNKLGYSDAYKDVVHEYTLKIGGSIKAPDYSFRVGGSRKFFVEAKKPSVNIMKDPDPAFQLKRYAWSAKLPVSILTNFRDFAIYDCTKQPVSLQSPATARVLHKTFDEFVSDWDEIADLVGKTGVLKGGLDEFAGSPAVRKGSLEVDDAFLQSMEAWRSELAQNIAHRNKSLSIEELNDAVQRTLDRIVFLRIAEDRGIEAYGQLQEAIQGNGIYSRLVEIFLRADDRYNSGLFHFHAEKGVEAPPDEVTPSLVIDDRVLRAIIKRLYYPDSPYEFSVLSADILGQVYEQFLGKVIRLNAKHEARIEEKPEVKKAGGIYYTPVHIVRHIVARTVGEAARTASPASLRRVKILDPACGSGSFLIEVYQFLLDWYLAKYLEASTPGARKRMYATPSGELRLSLEERRRILLDHIFGVDLDRQAVEVTKLSLLMKLLEGETDESINTQLELLPVRVLPDLDKNIRCGNSIIDPDIEERLEVSDEEYVASRPFEWASEFPDAYHAGGFDVVLGNPPYDVIEKDRSKSSWPHSVLREYVSSGGILSPALGRKWNMYRFFIVKSLQLTRPNGRWGMIVPLSLMADLSTSSTRKFLLENTTRLEADCFPQKDNVARRVFKNAKLSTVVVAGGRTQSGSGGTSIQLKVHPGRDFDETVFENRIRVRDLSYLDPESLPIPMTSSAHWELCRKLHQNTSVKLAKDIDFLTITRGEINQTIYRSYISDDSGRSRLLKGSELEPFGVRDQPSQGAREWFDSERFHRDFPKRKRPVPSRIALQRITGVDERRRLCAVIIEMPCYFADSTNSVAVAPTAPSDFMHYLTTLFNSDLFQWRFKITSSNNNVGTNEIETLPILLPAKGSPDHELYLKLAQLSAQIADDQAHLDKTGDKVLLKRAERRVRRANDLVFELYGVGAQEQLLVLDTLDGSRSDVVLPRDADST